jgi:glycosyltransferase involved in cell wall biosynthesis
MSWPKPARNKFGAEATLRTLIMTLPPYVGGVPAKTRWLCEALRARGHDLTVAYYATFERESGLNAPSWTLAAGRRPGCRTGTCFDGIRAVAVGSWLPELEFTYYLPSARWSELIASHDHHVAVGGQVSISYPLAVANIPHLVWCASSVDGDRTDRVRAMPWPRRLIDGALIAPRLRAMEYRILSGAGRIFGVSRYTARALGHESDGRIGHLPIPVDIAELKPPEHPPRPGVIGFAGRFNDPRKNMAALIAAVARARGQGHDIRLKAVGAAPDEPLRQAVRDSNLDGVVDFPGEVGRERLIDFYREIDVFVVPSHQEGLCIAGIEALACGVPVVSTRCGGPEDYVRPGETGVLVGSSPDEIAEGIVSIVRDRNLRARLSQGARTAAENEYSPAVFRQKLAGAWRTVWGEDL